VNDVAERGALIVTIRNTTMTDLTQKYLDKELVASIPEKLPPDYDEWLDTQQTTMPEMEAMGKVMDEFFNKIFKPF
jgi:hypothetical protein